MPQKVIIDTDPGIDDALALLLALSSPGLDVAAVTTVCGNVGVDTATRNLFAVLNLLPGPYPVLAKGAARPLVRKPLSAGHIHGKDGLGGVSQASGPDLGLSERDGADEILHQLSVSKREPIIISLGPLTNLALARDRDPELFSSIKRLIMMGGAFFGPGNITPAAEFNIFADPDAAGMVFSSGIPITAVGLDVTRQVRLDRPAVEKLVRERDSEITRCIQAWTRRLLDSMEELEGEASMPLHDPLAVLVCLQPDLVKIEAMPVVVETSGRAATGLTLADLRPLRQVWKDTPNLEVCTEVESRSALEMFLEGIP